MQLYVYTMFAGNWSPDGTLMDPPTCEVRRTNTRMHPPKHIGSGRGREREGGRVGGIERESERASEQERERERGGGERERERERETDKRVRNTYGTSTVCRLM